PAPGRPAAAREPGAARRSPPGPRAGCPRCAAARGSPPARPLRACASEDGVPARPAARGPRRARRGPPCVSGSRARGEGELEVVAGADPELAVRRGEVRLDRLDAQEQRVADLAVA